MSDPTSDYQQGYVDGMTKVRELIEKIKPNYGYGGMLNARALEALEQVSELIDAALHPPPSV